MHTTFRGNSEHCPARAFRVVQAFPERLSPSFRRSGGFTLIELLAVVVLLAILSSVAVMSLDTTRSSAELDATRFEMAEIRKALLQFKYDVRHFPDSAGLIDEADRLALLRACQDTDSSKVDTANGVSYDAECEPWDPDLKRGWNGPYISPGGEQDAWGNEYRLFDPGSDAPGSGTARIVSHGPNGVYEGNHATDLCRNKDDASDDIVKCLVQ